MTCIPKAKIYSVSFSVSVCLSSSLLISIIIGTAFFVYRACVRHAGPFLTPGILVPDLLFYLLRPSASPTLPIYPFGSFSTMPRKKTNGIGVANASISCFPLVPSIYFIETEGRRVLFFFVLSFFFSLATEWKGNGNSMERAWGFVFCFLCSFLLFCFLFSLRRDRRDEIGQDRTRQNKTKPNHTIPHKTKRSEAREPLLSREPFFSERDSACTLRYVAYCHTYVRCIASRCVAFGIYARGKKK